MRFGATEVALIAQVQSIAEELVGEHFRLTSFGPQHSCYEIVTLATGDESCREPTALAKLSRFDRQERPISDGRLVSRFYEICLQDDNLLRRVAEGLGLKALLLYVLTHELIHIVRFESFQVHFNPPDVVREEEEETVHHLTEQVLGTLRDRDVDRVIEDLKAGGVDVLVTR